MATFRKLSNGKWFLRVRRTGFPKQSQALLTQLEAELWTADIESVMLQGTLIAAKQAEQRTLAKA